MEAFFSKKKRMRLSALIVGGMLCASSASAAELVAAGEADAAQADLAAESSHAVSLRRAPAEAAPDFTAPLLGTEGDQAYIDANVRQADGTYRFTKDSLIFYQNEKDEDLGAIRLLADLKIDAANHILTVKTNTTMGSQGKAAAIQNNGKNLDIKAGTLRLLTNVAPQRPGYAWGILNESGTTTISGMTEIDSYGLTTTHAVEAKTGTVTLEGLKAKTVDRPGSMALLAGTSGQIFVNAAGGTAGSHIVNLDGNVGAMGDASRIDVAMMNQDSGLNGLAFGKGQINFWLQDGAVWKNDMNKRSVPDKTAAGIGKEYDYTFEGSRLSSLRGGADADHAGLIFQKNDKDITVDNYSGYTRVFYEHDKYFDPKKMKGGDFIIKKAAPGSGITLTTDSVGLKLDSVKASEKNLISDTLDALAKKLRYTAYTTNERNLTGKVEIAEGLTSSAVSKRLGDITFDATTGQGSHVYTPAVDAAQGKTEFTTHLSGTAADQEYADANVRLSDGTYLFQKASSIAYQNASVADSGAIKANGDVYIDTQDNALTVTSGAKTADVKEAAAIVNDDGKTVEIKGKTLKLTVNDTTSAAPLERAWGIRMTGGTLSLLGGATEIDVGGSKESRAVQVSGGTLSIDNLKAKTNVAAADSAVLFAQNDASIGAAKELMLDGHIVAKDEESRIDLNFVGNKSYLKGYAYGAGEIYMTLTGGATWYNEKQNSASPTGFSGSRVTGFKGDMLSWIFQRDDKDITIEEFSDGSYMNVIYEHDAAAPKNIKGGDIVINTAWGNTTATLITDSAGLNTEPTASRAEKNLVSETLNALAGKLRYTDYTPNESTLTGRVQISEGLTSASVGKRLEYITFDETTGRGKYLYTPLVEPSGEQTNTDFTTGITGREIHDAPYVNAGVRKADGQYIFTKDSTITSGKDIIEGGGWLGKISAAISNSNSLVPLNIDLNGRNLTVKTTTNISTTGISSIGAGSKINIKNPGAVSIDAESTSTGNAAALFVNSGGAIHIENGGGSREDKVLKLRANSTSKSDVAVIKSMNGAGGVQSNITIDGLVDVLADGDTTTNGKGANEAVSAVASKIDIGGGTIRATGGAWAAIRAYGEFTSGNYGTVNFNVTKDKDGLANGAGENRAVIEGDLVTNGGMGTKGRISVGLSTPESYWLGNYADASGYGVTQGQLGSVNLFMKNGSYWKGFSNGTMKMEMSGEGTKWTGFNISNNLQLALSDGAIWYNAITPEQTDQKDKPAISRVYHFTGSGGFIDMTGANRFLASSSSLNGNPVQTGSSAIEEKGLGETGDLTIANYSGDTKVIYRHDAATPTTVYGGKLTIEKAAANSSITLSTDSVGLDTESKKAADKNLVSATLNALANKLWYTAYTTGEKNLAGTVEIAEGLTTSSEWERFENITFNSATGQGGYTYTPAIDPQEFTTRLLGTAADQEYIDANVRQADGTYRFTKYSAITHNNATVEEAGVIHPLADVKVDASGHALEIITNADGADQTAAVRNSGKNLEIKAGTLRLQANPEENYTLYAWGIRNESGTTSVSGMTEIAAVGYSSSRAVEATEGKVTLEGLKATVAGNRDAMALLAGSSGQIFANTQNGAAGSHVVKLDGNIGAMGEASRIDVAMVNGDSGLHGLAFGKGKINFQLQNGAVWTNEKYGFSVPDKDRDGIGKDYDYTFAGSHLSSLKGGSDADHAGAIFQKNDKDITVDNYSGHTRVFYAHEAEPTKMVGGDLRVKNAAAGSTITLTTDSAGLKLESAKAADRNLVSETLDALAKKLHYTAYTTGQRNLMGKAEIAEGLTTSSASKRLENITFDKTTGQGGYVYTPAVDPAGPEQLKTEFTTQILGKATDQEYIDANVRLSDGTYHFTKDSSITYQNASAADSGAIKADGDVHIEAEDNVLTVTSGAKTADVKEAAAIVNDDGKNVEIKAKTLKLTANDTTSAAPLERAWGIRMTGGTMTVEGMTEIDVSGTKESKAVEVSGGELTLGGLKAKINVAAADSAALFAQNDGYISVGMDVQNPKAVMLDGHILAKDAASKIGVSLRGKDAYLKGYTYGDGEISMSLDDAAWYHEKQGAASPTGFTGSHLKHFSGSMGDIFQRDDKDITIDDFEGITNVFYEHDAAAPTRIKGGDIIIKKVPNSSIITLITDSTGLNTNSAASPAEKNLVSATLNALAGKLWYTGYMTEGWRRLAGNVQIAEGLTSSSAKKRVEKITFDETTGRGKYLYKPLIEPPSAQTDTVFTTSITGKEAHDAPYVNAGIRKADGSYVFTKDTTITTGKDIVEDNLSAAVSSANTGKTLDVDLNGRNLAIKTTTDVSTTGISAIGQGSKVDIKNAGAISVDAESTGGGRTAALYAGSSGTLHIGNGGGDLESKVLKVRANGNSKSDVAVIKAMGDTIMIDGLVDVLADGDDTKNGKGANEAVSTVASTINIGGGTIRAINGAWAAIRAYGAFTSNNYGIVNFNVTTDAEDFATGAGTNRAVLEGDIVTNGGMGTKGRVGVGLSTAESHWIGNYTDAHGYGVTQGKEGEVRLFMKNGAYWKGFADGRMHVEMSGANTQWTGFNLDDDFTLTLKDGAVWHNAITPEQKNYAGEAAISRVRNFSGDGGIIDMTGAARFFGKSKSLSGGPVQTGAAALEEKGLGETGDLTIANYSGNTKVLYRHEAATPTTVYGGKLTIEKAAAGSAVTLSTDSVGLNTESTKAADKNLVSAALNALANKLWYTAYTTGEKNLAGKAEIAEGLTTSAVSKRLENITFAEATGQGGYTYTPAVDPKPDQPKPDQPKPDQPKPDQPKPDQPKPDQPKPDQPKPDQPKPDQPKPDQPKPDQPKPDQPKPDQPKPDQPKPDQPKPDQPKPDQPKPDQPKPDQPKPDQPKPDQPKPDPKIEYGDYETKLMSGVKSAMTAATMAWRAEANDLMKRMGDLRLSPEDEGIWARVYRGKSSSDKDNVNFSMNYTTIQVGYDKKVSDDWRVGVAGSYMKGSSSYANGSGENREGNLGVYGTWSGKNGEYVDLIAKIGRLTNEYSVYNNFGHYVKGDFHTWGTSLSAEYGRRIELKGGSFVEPQVELIYSHLNGVNYEGETDYAGQSMHVRQSAMNSFVGRLGIGFGQETERGTWFLKASLYHEFAGDLSTEYSGGSTNPWKKTQQKGKDTWVGIQLGGTTKLNDRTSLYGTFEKTFGGDIKTAWRVDAGIRWNF